MKALSRLISHGHIDTLDHCLSTGKEANVFRATTPEGAHVAVKIYRVHTSTFRAHQDYIWGDPRFSQGNTNKREVVGIWATKEFKNLTRLLDAGCRVPTPFTVRENVLVMEFIGEDGLGAPMLKQVKLEDPEMRFKNLLNFIETAWQEANLVHGDLSEYNVLVHWEDTVVIDTAQSVVCDHPRAKELLERDVGNLVRYFKRYDIREDPDALVANILAEDDEEDENEEA